ncbi:MAG: cytochrome P450 [Polyangiales bacterium]
MDKSELSLPPGPRALPWLGHLPAFLADPLAFLTKLQRDYGDVVAFRVGLQPSILISDPALIDRVVRDRTFERTQSTRKALGTLAGIGLLSLEGSQHLRHRRLMAPAFHRERIKRYVDIMAHETYRMLESWQSGQERDLREAMMRLTFSIVSRSLFNTDTGHEAERVDAALQTAMPWIMPTTMLSRLVRIEQGVYYGKRARAAIAELHQIVRDIVRERRASGEDRGDLLSMLISARDEDGSALTDQDIGAETLTMLLAGHDTTAHTMTWAWYLLTQNPTLLDALTQEVRGTLGEREVGFDDLPRLTLTDRVVRETLRLYPPAWFADRVNAQDTELGGFHVPAGTEVVWSTWVTQRDPRWFANPVRFDPERFRAERAQSVPEGAYLPFGGGVHMCIGNTFALTEARVILAAMAQRFDIRATPHFPVRPRPMVTLGMQHPFAVVPTRHTRASTFPSALSL